MSQFGNFHLFIRSPYNVENNCLLVGFKAVGGGQVRNLGSIILCAFAVLISLFLFRRSERKQAAVGRREIQIFLIGYAIISIAEIFTVGGIVKNEKVLIWFSAIHIGAITATAWILLLNAVIGYQLLDDGTMLSMGLVLASSLMFFLGTGYIALDTGFGITNTFVPNENLRSYALYVLYLLFPLILLVAYFLLETVLVLHVLGETRPMLLLGGSAMLFAIGQIFDFVISVHICNGTKGKIDGSLFETLFTLLAVIALWFFWSSITEDIWVDEPLNPSNVPDGYTENRYRDSQYA